MRKNSVIMAPQSHNSGGQKGSIRPPAKPVSASSEISAISELLTNPSLAARRLTMPPGKVIFDQDTEARNLYFLHRGQVRVQASDPVRGAIRLVDILGAGDWFGEVALEKKPFYTEQAIVVVASIVTEVAADKFLTALANHPKALNDVVRQLAKKVSAASHDASSMVFDDCYARLLKTLIRFSTSSAALATDGVTVLRITHLQLAQCVGVARETISLALTQLRHKNVLRTGRNQLSFKVDALKSFLHDYEKTLKPVEMETEDPSDN